MVCFYQRWRKAKQTANATEASEPPFFFQPETPVFLIGRDGKQHLPSQSSNYTIDLNESQRTIASDTDFCNRTQPNEKKSSNLRQLYTSFGMYDFVS